MFWRSLSQTHGSERQIFGARAGAVMTTIKSQKYHNAIAYNPARHGQSRQVKQAASVSLGGLCGRCTEKIAWRKKYDKYKPLTVPKKWWESFILNSTLSRYICSTLCEQKTVKQAYHQLCQPCAEMKGVCAKCVKNTHIVERYYISATVYKLV